MKKILVLAITISLLLGIFSFATAIDNGDIELSIPERTWQGNNLVLSLTNNTGLPITLTDPIQVKITHINFLGSFPSDWEVLDPDFDVVLNGQDEFTVAAGETAVIAEIAPGMPGSWRGFYFDTRKVEIKLMVDGKEWESNDVTTEILHEKLFIIDMNTDFVYFPGDNLHFRLTDLPIDYCEVDGPINDPGMGNGFYQRAKLFFLIGNMGEYMPAPIIEGLIEGEGEYEGKYYLEYTDLEGEIEVQGIISQGVPLGEISYEIYLYDDVHPSPFIVGPKPLIPDEEAQGLRPLPQDCHIHIWVGVNVPDSPGFSSSPPLQEFTNLFQTDKEITFTSEGFGSISFAEGLNLMDGVQHLASLGENLRVTYDTQQNLLRASVDTDTLNFLADHGAVIRFFNAMEKLGLQGITAANILDYINVDVLDGGESVTDISDYLDMSGIVYDSETDILTIPVNHFTEYLVGVKDMGPQLPDTGSPVSWFIPLGLLLAIAGLGLNKFSEPR